MTNFGSFCYFQTSLSPGVGQVLQKLPKFDINDLKLLFHSFISRKCLCKTLFKTQCPPLPHWYPTATAQQFCSRFGDLFTLET